MPRRILKIAGLAAAAFAVLVAAAVGTLAVGGDRLAAGLFRDKAQVLLGRPLDFGGLHIAWADPIVITAEDARLANASWGKAPALFAAKRIVLAIEPWPLLRLRLAISRLEFSDAELHLERSPSGETNWTLPPVARRLKELPSLASVDIDRGAVSFDDGKPEDAVALTIVSLHGTTAPQPAGAMTIVSDGSVGRAPYAVTLKLGSPASGGAYPAALDGTLGKAKLTLDGTVAKPRDFDGVDLHVAARRRGPPAPFRGPRDEAAGRLALSDRGAFDAPRGGMGGRPTRGEPRPQPPRGIGRARSVGQGAAPARRSQILLSRFCRFPRLLRSRSRGRRAPAHIATRRLRSWACSRPFGRCRRRTRPRGARGEAGCGSA
ncbi:MAG: AsmA family protein, partial [Alphaproteobacteria bacterium]|nr:AsmA family protein [Alphaproteobacteria bacterium]